METVMPTVFGFIAILMYAVLLAAVIWGFYLAYLVTRALQKYLRS